MGRRLAGEGLCAARLGRGERLGERARSGEGLDQANPGPRPERRGGQLGEQAGVGVARRSELAEGERGLAERQQAPVGEALGRGCVVAGGGEPARGLGLLPLLVCREAEQQLRAGAARFAAAAGLERCQGAAKVAAAQSGGGRRLGPVQRRRARGSSRGTGRRRAPPRRERGQGTEQAEQHETGAVPHPGYSPSAPGSPPARIRTSSCRK
ncbi:MAG: hypothetical protein M5U13_14880 [Thermoanaerobaculia bacterium]|nr:hypothetical protein [Thermoanaerobaculia bacterium]